MGNDLFTEMRKIEGVFPAIPAVFGREEELCTDEIKHVINFVNNTRCSGISLNLIGGEFYKLASDELRAVMEVGLESNRSGNLCLAGISAPGTATACRQAKLAQDMGVDAVVAMPPFYNPTGNYGTGAILRHFDRLLGCTDLPLVIQDFNYGIPVNMLRELLDEHSNLAGIKVEGRNRKRILRRIREIRKEIGPDFSILGGMLGLNIKDEIGCGSSGTIPGTSLSDFLSEAYLRIRVGDFHGSHHGFLNEILSLEAGHLKYFIFSEKAILKFRGIIGSDICRGPYEYPRKPYIENLLNLVGKLLESNQNSRLSISGS